MSLPTIFGTWSSANAGSSQTPDLEAQVVHGTRIPITPQPARTHRPASPPTTDPIDDFFGATRTHESRHDQVRASVVTADAPPPYPVSDLPEYSETEPRPRPVTLAMYLFKYGFLFPPFWLIGTIILLSPLSAPADWQTDKSEAERAMSVAVVRGEEQRWARRCACALLGLILAVVIVVVICMTVLKWT